MQVSTGQVVSLDKLEELRGQLHFDPNEWVEVTGTPEQVERLSQRVKLGAAEIERRRKRRRQQAASRRANRTS